MNLLLSPTLRALDRHRALLPLLLAVAAGLLAAWAAQRHLDEQVQRLESERRQPMAERLVAAYDLPAGEHLVASQLALRQFPLAAVASDSLEPIHFEKVLGRRLRQALRAGDPLLPAHLAPPAAEALSRQLPAGRRAVTLPADAIQAATGLLRAGDRIDLYVSFQHGQRRLTMPLMQDVRVLAAGKAGDMAEAGPSAHEGTVTLEAAPEETVKLVAARQAGNLTAVLRPSASGSPPASEPSGGLPEPGAVSRGDLASLLGLPEPAPPPREVEVLYGNAGHRRLPAPLDAWAGAGLPGGANPGNDGAPPGVARAVWPAAGRLPPAPSPAPSRGQP